MDEYVFLSLKLQNGDITFEEFDRLEAMEAERASAYAANDTMGGTKEDYLIKNNPRVPFGNLNLIDKPKVSEDYNIDHLLVGTPSNSVDFNELRKIAEAKHATKPEPLERNFSEFAASIPKLDPEQVVREAVANGMRKDQYDKDYQEGLARWDAMNKKVATPVFKVGGGIGKTYSGGSLQNDFISPTVDLPGPKEVINSEDVRKPEAVTTPERDFGLNDGLTNIERINRDINTNSATGYGKDGIYVDRDSEGSVTGAGYRWMF